MKDQFLSLLVNETLNLSHDTEVVLKYNPKSKSYSLKIADKILEFPQNWDAFSDLTKNGIAEIKDKVLLGILSEMIGSPLRTALVCKTGSEFKIDFEYNTLKKT